MLLTNSFGPWPPPDITLFSRVHELKLPGASDLASLFFKPGVFLFSIPLCITTRRAWDGTIPCHITSMLRKLHKISLYMQLWGPLFHETDQTRPNQIYTLFYRTDRTIDDAMFFKWQHTRVECACISSRKGWLASLMSLKEAPSEIEAEL